MSTNSNEEDQRKAIDNDSHIVQMDASITNGNENSNTSDANENKDEKMNSRSEVVVKIDDNIRIHEDLKGNRNDPNFMGYSFYGQNKVMPTTWVYFQTTQALPEGNTPLNYSPERNYFVRLVFTLVFIMIATTAAINMIVIMTPVLADFFRTKGMILVLVATGVMIGLNYAMACSACTRVRPCNIICLVLAVFGMSMICCFITVKYDTKVILLAVVSTAGVVLVCLCLACTNFDFTKLLLYVVVVSAAFGLVVIICTLYMVISGNYIKILHLVILCVGTIINVVVLIIELQMILGGKAVELGEDDYALGAYLLYTSIIDIFLKMVQLIGMLEDF